MQRLYFLSINLIFATLIGIWYTLSLFVSNFQPAIKWAPDPNIVATIFIIIACVIIFFVTIRLIKKFLETKKDSTLLLATFNITLSLSLIFELIRHLFTFISVHVISSFVYGIIFLFLAWGFLFFLLFLQDIFTGTFSFKKHKITDIIFLGLIGFGISGFILDSFNLVSQSYTIPSFAALGITILLFCLWEVIGASRLIKKVKNDKTARIGLIMIALSGLVFIALVVAILVNIYIDLSIFIRILMATATLLLYMGYVYPSRQKRTN
ncbi:MAG TPA: hypothetical protein VKM55_16315 [Candidatus Lokiarchaeia archaeon]|nr:hypothetical protein [Candidatus Lokiarchaeia archaeon]